MADSLSLARQIAAQKERDSGMTRSGAPTAYNPSKIKKTDNVYDPNLYNASFSKTPYGQVSDNLYSADADTRLAQTYLNQYYYGNDRGSNITRGDPGTYKRYEQAANKVALKKALAQGISGAPEQLASELGLLKSDADQALTSGLKSTRKNFNDRGLLYSGMREGGEQQVKGRVAGALAEGDAAARRDSANVVEKRKQAFASIGLAEQEQKNQLAQQAFETSYKNSIARRQALEAAAGGVGQGIGMYYGQQGRETRPANTSDPNGGY